VVGGNWFADMPLDEFLVLEDDLHYRINTIMVTHNYAGASI
jgi:hypothetical protein